MKNFGLAHAPDGLFLQKHLDRNRQRGSPQGPRLLLHIQLLYKTRDSPYSHRGGHVLE